MSICSIHKTNLFGNPENHTFNFRWSFTETYLTQRPSRIRTMQGQVIDRVIIMPVIHKLGEPHQLHAFVSNKLAS